jgi:hypothetical protein
MEGLYYESSSTTPYHFLTEAEVAAAPSDPMAGLKYRSFDLTAGVAHMRLEGVRYYMAFSSTALRAAAKDPQLHEVARSGPWHVFAIQGASVVTPMTYRPAVALGVGGAWTHWLHTAQPWFLRFPADPSEPFLTASGQPFWQRVARGAQPARVPLPTVHVTGVRVTADTIAFHVDTLGVPVLVKTSYFPNWQATGAVGPYRATPNFMIVVPVAHAVRLHYGWTPVDVGSGVASLVGIVALLPLGLFYRRRPGGDIGDVAALLPEDDAEPEETDERPRDPAQH